MSLRNLFRHTATIVQAASATGSYGHTDVSWTSGTTSTASIAGLLQARAEREQATGAVVSSHVWFMAYEDAPASLLAHGAEKTHRLTTVVNVAGTTIDAGPFDVVEVQDAAGQEHHLELRLMRVG
jgi:hypothetical protein